MEFFIFSNVILVSKRAIMMFSIRRTIFLTFLVTTGIPVNSAEVCPAADKKEWTYRRGRSNGPDHWGGHCNTGHQQSPINIITSEVLQANEPQILMLRNFDKPIEEVLLENHGQYFTITPKDGVNRSLILNGNEYPFRGFHFHFGNTADGHGGSEHTIDGQRFPMEAHFIFVVADDRWIQASTLFEIGDELNPALMNILSVRQAYKYEGGKFEGKIQRYSDNPRRQGKIYLDDLLDLNCPYFRYAGSHTFPPCNEVNLWLICKTHKYVKYSQLRRLSTFHTVTKEEDVQNDCLMKYNNRQVQDRNNRPVYG